MRSSPSRHSPEPVFLAPLREQNVARLRMLAVVARLKLLAVIAMLRTLAPRVRQRLIGDVADIRMLAIMARIEMLSYIIG